jgi:nitroreductase/NAD-dependent dihydropyrimidine dehydrogenase PreA subunit
MPVPASGVDPFVLPVINPALCTNCAKCAFTCPSLTLVWENSALRVDTGTALGCIACGQCMAICPSGAVTVDGRGLSPADMLALPALEQRASPGQFDALALSRRSIRHFAKRDVDPDVVRRILETAATAPMGIPPSPVHAVVLNGADKVQQYAEEMIGVFKRNKGMLGLFTLPFMRPIIGRYMYAMMKDFIIPIYELLIAKRAEGVDALFYDAPLVFQFHASPYADAQDCCIVATYAMLAAQSHGLGTCMIGTVPPMLGYAKPLLKKYGIPAGHKIGVTLIAGYPAVEYGRTVRRKLGGVNNA